jgi:DNA gyrase subunit A
MVTRRGEVKKVHIHEFAYFRSTGFKIFDLEGDDELCWVKFTSGSDDIVCVTHHGQSIRFSEDNVRSMGRTAGGVRALRLKKDDYVVAMDVAKAGWQLLVATNKGFGKRTDLNDYRRQARGGSGILTMNCTEKVGKIVDACVVRPDDKVIFITANGIVMRTRVSEIRQTGRHAQGVRLIKLEEGDSLVSMERVAVEERSQDQPELNV